MPVYFIKLSAGKGMETPETFWSECITRMHQALMCLPRAGTVNYVRARDDGFLLIFTSKFGIISFKRHRGHIGDLRR